MTGYEVLEEVKRDPALSMVPVLIMSGSEAEADVTYCYAMGCAAYIVKPGSPETAAKLCEAVERIWFTLGRTPRST